MFFATWGWGTTGEGHLGCTPLHCMVGGRRAREGGSSIPFSSWATKQGLSTMLPKVPFFKLCSHFTDVGNVSEAPKDGGRTEFQPLFSHLSLPSVWRQSSVLCYWPGCARCNWKRWSPRKCHTSRELFNRAAEQTKGKTSFNRRCQVGTSGYNQEVPRQKVGQRSGYSGSPIGEEYRTKMRKL